MKALLGGSAAMFACATLAAAQAPMPPAGPSDQQIVVTAPAPGLEEQVHAFVQDVLTAPHQAQVGRWDEHICPGVFGLTNRAQAQFIVDGIARRAQALRLVTGEPGCHANIFIFITPDAPTLANEIARQFPMWLLAGNTGGYGRFPQFVTEERPVRWWNVSQTVREFGHGSARDGRLARNEREDFSHVAIIVDARRVAETRLDVLTDYLAMVSLANPNPAAHTDQFTTVLNLFADPRVGRPRPEGMSEWDIAYLDSLYRMQRNAVNASRQRGEVSSRMFGALSHF